MWSYLCRTVIKFVKASETIETQGNKPSNQVRCHRINNDSIAVFLCLHARQNVLILIWNIFNARKHFKCDVIDMFFDCPFHYSLEISMSSCVGKKRIRWIERSIIDTCQT